jgi:hypothetical protein
VPLMLVARVLLPVEDDKAVDDLAIRALDLEAAAAEASTGTSVAAAAVKVTPTPAALVPGAGTKWPCLLHHL